MTARTSSHAKRLLAVTLAVGVLQAGCGGGAATRRGTSSGEEAVVDLATPSASVPHERFLKPEPAFIAPGDQLEQRILSYADLSGLFWVAQDGRVNLPLVGTIEAAGKSSQQLSSELRTAYGAYLRNLDLTLNVVNRAPRYVYVLGEVRRPGRFDLVAGDRVLHGIADAGGMQETARENSVILMRRELDGVDHAYRLDFSHMHKTLAPKDIYLLPGDVVFVPKSRFRTMTEFTSEFIDLLSRGATTAILGQDLLQLRARTVTVGTK